MKKQIEKGEASVLIELKDGDIVAYHGTDKVQLLKIPQAEAGSWGQIWEALFSLCTVEDN